MAEISLVPTVQSKVIPLSLRLNDTDTSLVSQLVTNRQFNTADTDAWFSFTLEGLAATTGTFDLTLINLHDKSVFNHTDKVFNTNPFYYKLDSGTDELTNEIRHAGKWVGQLVVTLANGDSATRKFIFGIEGHILDGTVVQTIRLEDYNALIASIESAKDELTQYNIDYASLIGTVTEQEAARLEAEELRVIADALRETKEGIRQATFEANEVIRDGVVDSAIEGEMISQTVATKLTEKEATFAPRMLSLETQLADIDSQVDLLNRGLGETFATLVALQTAYPTGDTKDHIVGADGHRYYWNDTAWADGGAYQAVELTDGVVVPAKTNFLKLISNLFDKTTVTLGKYTSAGGTISSENWGCSDYILLTPGTYFFSGFTSWLNFFSTGLVYDASKDLLSAAFDRVLVITEECYVRFSFIINVANPKYNDPETLSLRNASEKLDSDTLKFGLPFYGSDILKDSIEGTSLKRNAVSSNKLASKAVGQRHIKPSFGSGLQGVFAEFVPTLAQVTSGYFDVAGVLTSNATYYVTDYIEIAPSTKYFLRKGFPSSGSFYTADKKYIAAFGNGISDVSVNLEIQTPARAIYIRYNGKIVDLNAGRPNILVQSDTAPSDWTKISYEIDVDWLRTKLIPSEKQALITEAREGISSVWVGKTFVSLGDSITEQDGVAYSKGDVGAIARGYQTIMKETLGFASYNNKGISGRPMADGTANGVGTVTTGLAVTYTGYDLTTIAAGTNDFKLNVSLGTLGLIGETTFDRTKFYGAYRTLIEYILTQKPTERIVLFTPLQRDNSGYDVNYTNSAGHKLIDYVNAIKAIGQMYGIPVCDLYNNSGITKLTLATYLMDGLHPNDTGYARMGGYAAKFIDNIGL